MAFAKGGTGVLTCEWFWTRSGQNVAGAVLPGVRCLHRCPAPALYSPRGWASRVLGTLLTCVCCVIYGEAEGMQYEFNLCGGKVKGLARAYVVAGESGHISASGTCLLK